MFKDSPPPILLFFSGIKGLVSVYRSGARFFYYFGAHLWRQ